MTGAVTTPHSLATEAGMAVLRAGGTAPEALIAAGAVLTVVMPHFCGLGGDAVWLVADRHGAARSFLAIGQGTDRPMPKAPIPQRGPGAVLTTAAAVDGWRHALDYAARELGGRCRWHDLLAPAIRLAQDGFAVSTSQEFWTHYRAAEVQDWHGFGDLFLSDGQPIPAGRTLRQPRLAESLAAIANNGAREFYAGDVAQRIVAGLCDAGVVMSADDLRRTRTSEAAPLSLPYRDLTLLAPPPPTQGMTTLQIMGILSRLNLRKVRPGSADHLHLCVEAVKRAFRDRTLIADPASMSTDPAALLDTARLDDMASDISDRALEWPQVWQHGDTVYLGAIDEAGNAASVLQSTYFDWGSGVVAGDTGILWQNRGAAFTTDPQHPNVFAPGKLPFYTLNPGIALRGGKPAFVYGTQGADGQPQTLAVLLTHLIDFAATPEVALAAPRFLLGRTFSDSRDSLKVEAQIGAEAIADLTSRGHEISPIPALSPLAGQAGVVLLGSGGAFGYHDKRN